MAASLWVILTIEKLAFVCINCNKSWCLNHTNFSRQINKINFQMMTDKDTKCLITKAKQDMMPQTPDHVLPYQNHPWDFVVRFLFGLSLIFTKSYQYKKCYTVNHSKTVISIIFNIITIKVNKPIKMMVCN